MIDEVEVDDVDDVEHSRAGISAAQPAARGPAPAGTIHRLLAESPRVRIRAIRDLPVQPATIYALRRVLYTDRHAEVRAAAARQLGRIATAEPPGAVAIAGWLGDALGDGSPLVRDAILRALARCGGEAARDRVRARITDDRMWWVRRTAIYALAALAAADELAAFEAALADPFWRVRHAAIKVLAALGARDLDVRAHLAAATGPAHALAYLRAGWGPALIETPQRAAIASQLPAALLDPDPAVVTARLATTPDIAPPVALVELLCDPHAPLRLLAADLIAGSGDLAAYQAALDWLEEPRIPHVADTVERLLDGLGDLAIAIAERALARSDRPGAARWAIGWVVATRYAPLAGAALARARRDARLRADALPLASIEDLVEWASPAPIDLTAEAGEAAGAPGLRDRTSLIDAIASELHGRRSLAALAALDGADQPRTRALQIDAAARAGRWDLVEHGLADPHHGPRAIAARWWVKQHGSDPTTRALAGDRDPSVREAALEVTGAACGVDDPDPWVARAAIGLLARRRDDTGAPPADLAIQRALGAADPWIRAAACRAAIASGTSGMTDRALAQVLGLVIDSDDLVRSAALDALGRVAALEARIAALVGDPGAALSAQAQRIAQAWLHGELAPPPVITAAGTPAPVAPPPSPAVVARRAFGRLGFEVAPLAISCAYDLSSAALATAADAGVDLWFWEPAYLGLGRFLRQRPRARVIAGSYHAEPGAIEADVDLALRRLRRDSLDVFLLFWSRSPARVDAEAYAALDRIRRTGKIRAIGFSTHDRALACTAIETSPWDVVMTRHSAAHPGIERELLPVARARGTAILTFSALCYGRMTSGPGAPGDADCIRYSLSQPGVTACINAPRRAAEVASRVAVLAAPTLAPERQDELRAHGIGVRAESQRFNALLRQPTRDAAAAAREMLAAELPPEDEIDQRPLPRPSHARPARTHLGRARRGRTT